MPRLFGAQRLVLQAILEIQGESQTFVEDARVAEATQIALRNMRDWLLTLDQEELVDLALTKNGLRASVTAKGRLALGLYRPFPTQPTGPKATEPSRSRSKTGREKALIIGISDYPPPIPKLPAVANDVREIARLLKNDGGQFPEQNVAELVDQSANKQAVLGALEKVFRDVQPDDAVFIYMAGHGHVENNDYYYIAHGSTPGQLAATGVPLTRIKAAFDSSPSQRAFLWLDFCHSGGIIPRELGAEPDDRAVIERTLKVVQGQGKLIIAACTPSQSAWESAALGHGLFTDALLRGLRGEAASGGEVTVNSLYDYIDRTMGSDRQRPMLFGQMMGRIVLMHHA